MNDKHSKLFLAVSMLVLLSMNHAISHAQDEEDSAKVQAESLDELDEVVVAVEEIIVTANRRQEMLQDVPLSIAAFTESFFKDTGLTDFKALEQYAASLRITGGPNARRTAIRIRGIGSSGFNAGIDPSVGVFIDGIYQGRAGMSVGDFIDVERVEVLRGPQGSLYGKNTAAGAISVISKQPGYLFESKNEVTMTNDNGREYRGMLNVPFAGDDSASAVRMAGYMVKRDGWDDNVTTGEEVNDADKWGVKARAYIDLEARNLGSITISVDYSKDEAICCSPDIISSKGPSTLGIPLDGLRIDADLDPPFTLPKDDPFDRKVAHNDDLFSRTKVNGVAVEWTMSTENDFIYTWINAHRHYEMFNTLDGDFTPFNGAITTTDVDLDQISSEFRIASPEGETIDYQVGLYFYHSGMRTIDTFDLKADLVSRLMDGSLQLIRDFSPYPGGGYLNTGDNLHKTTTYAMFGQTTWNISDEFDASLGFRYTRERKDRTGSQITTPEWLEGVDQGFLDFLDSIDVTIPEEVPPVAGFDIYFKGPNAESFTESNFSPTFSLRYYPRHKLMYYTSISQGFKSGGFNQLRTVGGRGTQFDDEVSTSYEIGWKGTWLDGGLQWNGTFFYVDYNEFQAQTWDGASMAVQNAGRLESKGLELELTYVPTMNLMMGGSFAYTKAKYKDFKNGECTVPDSAAAFEKAVLENEPPETCLQDLSGERLDNAPEVTVSTYLHYSRPFVSYNQFFWFARFEYIYTSSFYHSQDLDPVLKNDATDVVNIRLGIGDIEETWEAVLWSRNLTDEGYLVAAADIPVLSGYIGWSAPPRTYGLTVKYNF